MVDVVGAVGLVIPGSGIGDAEGVVDGGGHVFGLLGIGRGVATDLVRRTDDASSLHASAGEEDALNGTPVIAAGLLI